MTKTRKILLTVFSVCFLICLSFGIAACGPNFKPGGPFSGDYVVSVVSQGGLNVNDVEIQVIKDGQPQTNNLISVNGRIQFKLKPDVYELKVVESSLPAGFSVPDGAIFATSATEPNAKITLTSQLIVDESAPAGTRYRLGSAMYDFTFTEVIREKDDNGDNIIEDGKIKETYIEHNLAETLANKKAVMINFWGPDCGPCRAEFPAIEEAYNSYANDIEIFALASYLNPSMKSVLDYNDSPSTSFSFPIGLDVPDTAYPDIKTPAIYRLFNVQSYPTTVIVDRYGVVAYISSGTDDSVAYWKALFEKYTSDDYSQDDITSGDVTDFEWAKPTDGLEMPDFETVAQAITGEGAENKIIDYYGDTVDENAWPWVTGTVDDRTVIMPSHNSVDYTYSIFYATVNLQAGDGLSFDYFTDTKASRNIMYLMIDGEIIQRFSENSNGWHTYSGFYIANRRVSLTLAFTYVKSSGVAVNAPVYIDNISVYDATQSMDTIDLPYAVNENEELDANNRYNPDLTYDSANNYYVYHYTDNTGAERSSILYADILEVTSWTTMHYGEISFNSPEENSTRRYEASLYQLSYWFMRDKTSEYTYIPFDPQSYIIKNYYLQNFSVNPDGSYNGYVPVTEELKNVMIEFTKQAYDKFDLKDEWYEDQWLEFCYYFRHHGAKPDGHICADSYNPVIGMSYDHPLTATEGNTTVNITSTMNNIATDEEAGGGLKYKFTPSKTGVYLFTTTHEDENVEPDIVIRNSNMRQIAEGTNDHRYSHIFTNVDNVYMLVEMTAGQTYYIHASTRLPGRVSKYEMNISYYGEGASILRVATRGDGMWTWDIDNPDNQYYISINAALNPVNGIYYHNVGTASSPEYGSVIYIDFIRENFYNHNGRTLLEMINGGSFGDGEDKAKMLEYYQKSIAGKDKEEELYGFTEASEELINLIQKYLFRNETLNARPWMMFAGYYEYYGTARI